MPLFDRARARHAAPAFGVHVDEQDGAVTLLAYGELDMSAVAVLEEAFGEALHERPPAILLDLSRLTFLDAGGARTLHRLATRAARYDVPLLIRGATGAPRRALELTGISALLALED